MKTSIALATLAVASSAVADDVLYSKRHYKRFIDSDGNYNMCMPTLPLIFGGFKLTI